jgi:curli biogenesis system outer membrane secretion channel CsgG
MRKNLLGLVICIILASCSTQQKIIQVEPQVQQVNKGGRLLKRKVAISSFSNETQYAKGVFYDKENDPIAKQALDILSTKLASSGKFLLLERQDVDKIEKEMKLSDKNGLSLVGADYLIIGSVTEYGRKNIGDVNAFSRTKTQTVHAGVSIRLVDISTGQIIYSEEAKGEAETTNKTVLGYGERTDFDATLSDKAISVAISKLVENIINNCMEQPWKSYFLTYNENEIIISGGRNQGLKVDDVFQVFKRGKRLKNPQTGMPIDLPGEVVGKIKIDFTGGVGSNNEFSMVSFVEGSIDRENLAEYIIKEIP